MKQKGPWLRSRTKWALVHWRTSGAVLLGVVSAVVVWLQIVGCPWRARQLQKWLEAATGSNWPTDYESLLTGSSAGWFAAVLAARIAMSIAGIVGGLLALLWFLFGGLERLIMHVSRRELAHMFNTVLTPGIADLLEQRKEGLQLTEDDRAAMLAKANELVEAYQAALDRHYPDPE